MRVRSALCCSTPLESLHIHCSKGLEDSLSGSASSSSDDDSDEDSDDAVSSLIQKHKKHHIRANPNGASEDEDGPIIPRSPIVWFQSPSAPNTQLGAYAAIFPTSSQESYAEKLKEMQNGGDKGRRWALFMTAGGHFAGMIARVSKPGKLVAPGSNIPAPSEGGTGKKGKAKIGQVPDLEIIAHKTFHRYTSQSFAWCLFGCLIMTLTMLHDAIARRKQGGSQSVNDNAKGPAKSAGAQLRRYGEQALREVCHNYLTTCRLLKSQSYH